MKKMIALTLILVTVLALMIPAFASAGISAGTDMWVNCADGKRLNLRMDPAAGSKIIARLECGTKVTVDEDLGNGWAHVYTWDYTGYVQKKFLVAGKPGKYEITEREDNFVALKDPYTVSAKALNAGTDRSVGLRTRPNKTAKAIRRLVAGDQLQVIAKGKTWSRVVDLQTGKTGYVANEYVVRN